MLLFTEMKGGLPGIEKKKKHGLGLYKSIKTNLAYHYPVVINI